MYRQSTARAEHARRWPLVRRHNFIPIIYTHLDTLTEEQNNICRNVYIKQYVTMCVFIYITFESSIY